MPRPQRTKPAAQSNPRLNNFLSNVRKQSLPMRELVLAILVGLVFVTAYTRCSSVAELGPILLSSSTTTTPTAPEAPHRPPLQVFPLLKEMRTGWGNMGLPTPLKRDAKNMRALVVDVGLHDGQEFFHAISLGFEVVGLEPNPKSFEHCATKCRETTNCNVVQDIKAITLPLQRTPGHSYLVHAGAGAENGELELSLSGVAGSFVKTDNVDVPKAKVPVVRIDNIIADDVFLFKIDTQGFDYFVLQGSQKLFQQHVVRQVIFEVEPKALSKVGVTKIETILSLMQYDYGMMCFSDRNDNAPCDYLGDSAEGFTDKFFTNMKTTQGVEWAHCWEDFLCINANKIYPGPIPPLLAF